jgi:hypothetical protein
MTSAKPLILIAAMLTTAASPQSTKPAPAAPTPQSSAQSTAPATTLNCLLASNVFAQNETDPKQKTLALQTLYFYLGRIEPQTSPQQFKAALKRTADALKGVSAGPLMNACVRELQTKAEMLQSVGQELQQGK